MRSFEGVTPVTPMRGVSRSRNCSSLTRWQTTCDRFVRRRSRHPSHREHPTDFSSVISGRICATPPGSSAERPGSPLSALTLALGIGATAVMFSWVATILTAASPVEHLDRLAFVWSHNRTQGETKTPVSLEDFVEWRRRQQSFDRFSAQRRGAVNLSGADQPVRATADFATADFAEVFSQQPSLGRAFRPEEEESGAPRVAILSDRFWRERFGGRIDVLGREVLLDGRPATIVGVLPKSDFAQDLMLPLVIDRASRDYGEHSVMVVSRLRNGVSLEQARADMASIGEQLERELPDTHRGWGVNTRPAQEEFLGPQAQLVFALLAAAAGAVLLIGCANIANLLLARGIARARELAVRTAMGASRMRLVRQLLAESLVLAVAGTAAGLLVAQWGLGLLRATIGADAATRSIMERAVIDRGVLAFAASRACCRPCSSACCPRCRAPALTSHRRCTPGRAPWAASARGAFVTYSSAPRSPWRCSSSWSRCCSCER